MVASLTRRRACRTIEDRGWEATPQALSEETIVSRGTQYVLQYWQIGVLGVLSRLTRCQSITVGRFDDFWAGLQRFVALRQEGWQRRNCTRSEHVLMAVLFQEKVHEWEEMKKGCRGRHCVRRMEDHEEDHY